MDYEIYFGANQGTVDKCIIYPTAELIRIAEKHDVRFCFFVDCGFILKLDEFRKQYSQLDKDYKAITEQVKYLSDTGHDIQLHIHPHWEDSYYDGNKWVIDVTRYKLDDFTVEEIEEIVPRYKKVLTDLVATDVFAFRAGGWCLQPFDKIKKSFIDNGVTLDSSVYKNGFFTSDQYSYDFRNAPDKSVYRFEDDITAEVKDGFFTELPITSIQNNPLFFWMLFLLGRKNPYLHKPLGDGQAMPAPGYRRKLLTKYTINPVAVDGYNATLLNKVLRRLIGEKKEHMVVIGHPKALSRFSIQKIEDFVIKNKKKHNFTTYSKVFGSKK